MHDTSSSLTLPVVPSAQVTSQVKATLDQLPEPLGPVPSQTAEPVSKRGRGRPLELPEPQLWLGLLWAVLEGLGAIEP